jgi:two-component system, cell cycle sensor histidine kinase and response regulator CckA
VLVANGGREALALFRSRAADVDCVVLDMVMPDMSGSDVFRELRAIRGDVRVILSSGFSEQEAAGPFVGRGLSGFLRKPFNDVDLIAKVREALGKPASPED